MRSLRREQVGGFDVNAAFSAVFPEDETRGTGFATDAPFAVTATSAVSAGNDLGGSGADYAFDFNSEVAAFEVEPTDAFLRSASTGGSVRFTVAEATDVEIFGAAFSATTSVEGSQSSFEVTFAEVGSDPLLDLRGGGADSIGNGPDPSGRFRLEAGTEYEFSQSTRLSTDEQPSEMELRDFQFFNTFGLNFFDVEGGPLGPTDPEDPTGPVPIPTPAALPLGVLLLAGLAGRRRARA